MILSVGEALIDLIHSPGRHEPRAQVGGSPLNVSVALARLDITSGFVCPISKDRYGQLIYAHLQQNNVQQCMTTLVDDPTAIAEVFTDSSGHPRYVFHRNETADRALHQSPPITAIPDRMDALHFGSLVLAQAKDWPQWKEAIVHARLQGAFIGFDPNLRIDLIDDLSTYRTRLHQAVELAHLIKASDEDLHILDPDSNPETTIQQWLGPERMVVLTQGAQGSQAWTPDGGHFECRETSNGPIVDTVGAGDTFQAALLAWLSHHQAFHRTLQPNEVTALLRFATHAASLNCAQPGCQPPTLNQVLEALP